MDCKPLGQSFILLCAISLPAWSLAVPSPSVSLSPFRISTSSGVVTSTDVWRVAPNTAFQAGEDLFYIIRWGLITGGHSSLAIHGVDRINDRPAYHLVEEAHSSGFVGTFYTVHDRNDSWLDMASLTTLRYEKRIREGHFRIEENVDFDQANQRYRDYSNRLDKGTTEYIEGSVTPNILDVLGSLYYVRTLPLEMGKTYTMDVYDGKKIWPLVIHVKKREKVKVPAGKFECFRVEPLLRQPGIFVSKGKKLEVWLTADQYRIPVLMRSEIFIGHVSAELVSYHNQPSAAQ